VNNENKTDHLVKQIIVFLPVLMILSGCYDEGPYFTLRSKEKRLCGKWETSKVSIAEKEHKENHGARIVLFMDDGQYYDVKDHPVKGLVVNSGNWTFSDNSEQLILTLKDEFTGRKFCIYWNIKKLAYNEIHLVHTEGFHDTEWWLVRHK